MAFVKYRIKIQNQNLRLPPTNIEAHQERGKEQESSS